jgi:hypothetical protein
MVPAMARRVLSARYRFVSVYVRAGPPDTWVHMGLPIIRAMNTRRQCLAALLGGALPGLGLPAHAQSQSCSGHGRR